MCMCFQVYESVSMSVFKKDLDQEGTHAFALMAFCSCSCVLSTTGSLIDRQRAAAKSCLWSGQAVGDGGVLSRQYEAYVRDQCWTLEMTEILREEGHGGLRWTQITGGFVSRPQAE